MENGTAFALPKGVARPPHSAFPVWKLQPSIASFQHFKRLQKSSQLFKTVHRGAAHRRTGPGSPGQPVKDNGKRGSEEKLGSADSPAGSSRPNGSLRATLYLVHGACPRVSPCLLQLAFSSVTWEYQPLPVLETDYAVKTVWACV